MGIHATVTATFKNREWAANKKCPAKKEAGSQTINMPKEDTDIIQQNIEVVKKRYGRTVKKTNRLTYS